MSKRLVIGIADDTKEMLGSYAKKKGCSETEIIRRAIALYTLVEDELSKNKKFRLAIADGAEALWHIIYL